MGSVSCCLSVSPYLFIYFLTQFLSRTFPFHCCDLSLAFSQLLIRWFGLLLLSVSPSPPLSRSFPHCLAQNRRPRDGMRGSFRRGGGDVAVLPVGGGGVLGPSRADQGGVLCSPRRRGERGWAGGRGELGHHGVSGRSGRHYFLMFFF